MHRYLLSATLFAAASVILSCPAFSQSASMGQMSSSVDLNDPMSQEASGTAWLPESSPIYGSMLMSHGNMLMLHGAAMPRYTDVGSKRGDRRVDAPNWEMGMFSHPLTKNSQIGLRLMTSLDPITEGGRGYPLLFQTGETWGHVPLHDRQHPHNLQDEVAVTYSRLIGGGKSVYTYLAYPGEPAIGPPTYMHRLLAYDFADAPIGHHWQDATHITFGVATIGMNMSSKLKIEGSDFTGREPDEDRYSFQKPRFDSYSGRLSYNPDADDALQISYGLVHNPEGNGADVHRTTASWLYNHPLRGDSNFTTALVWGQNSDSAEGVTNSYLAEADYQQGKDTLFARIENIDKSGSELVLPEVNLQDRKFNIGAYSVGYVRDLNHGKGIDTGLGFALTTDTYAKEPRADYGSGLPLTFQIYLRFRPSRMKSMAMMDMSGMNMSSMKMAPDNNQKITLKPLGTMDEPKYTITSTTDKAISGSQELVTVRVWDIGGHPISGAKITSSLQMSSMDMGTTHPEFNDMGGGSYQGSVKFVMAGLWKLTISAILPGEDKPVVQQFDYNVGG